MYAQSLDARFDVVHILQGLRARHLPGSRRYEQIEHAIDLALNESRVADGYLLRNVMRDARRIQDRFNHAHHSVSLTHDSSEQSLRDSAEQYDQLTDYESPEALAVVHSEVHAILSDAGGPSIIVNRVWDGMISGESVAALTALTGFSPSYISKIRMTLARSAKARLTAEA